MVVKSIDLTQNHPLCDISSKPKLGPNCEEKWVEAYVINDAKEHGWQFKPSNKSDKSLRFLSSQLRFRKSDSLKINGTYHVITDVLFYDSAIKHLVIWELKSNANESSVNTAIDELQIYCKELTRLFIDDETEKCNARLAYGLEKDEISKVDGYVVLPKNNTNYKTCPYGLYEYSCADLVINHGKLVEPWKNYSRSMEINFELKCEPK